MPSAFQAVANDIGNTYQQVLFGGLSQSQDVTTDRLVSQVNPEYTRTEKAYIAQEQERGRMEVAYEKRTAEINRGGISPDMDGR